VPKRWKTNLHQICFSKPKMIWYHKGSPPFLFWDEKRSCLGRGGLLCGSSVPIFELDFCPDHWGGPFGPNLMNHLVLSFKHDLYQKSHISGHLLRRPPLRIHSIYAAAKRQNSIQHKAQYLHTCTLSARMGALPKKGRLSYAKIIFYTHIKSTQLHSKKTAYSILPLKNLSFRENSPAACQLTAVVTSRCVSPARVSPALS